MDGGGRLRREQAVEGDSGDKAEAGIQLKYMPPERWSIFTGYPDKPGKTNNLHMFTNLEHVFRYYQ